MLLLPNCLTLQIDINFIHEYLRAIVFCRQIGFKALRAFRHIIFALALVAALLQSLGVSVLRIAKVDDLNHASLICASPDKVISAQAAAAARELAVLLGQDLAPEDNDSELCEDCVMSVFAVLRAPLILPAPITDSRLEFKPRVNPAQFAHKPHGPPLGGRAPPTFI